MNSYSLRHADSFLAPILGKTIDYFLPLAGAAGTFVIMMIIGFSFYLLIFSGYIFFVYRKKYINNNQITFWEAFKGGIKPEKLIRTFLAFGFLIFVLYFFYRALLSAKYDYPDMAIINLGARWMEKQNDLSVTAYFGGISILLIIVIYIFGLLKKNNKI